MIATFAAAVKNGDPAEIRMSARLSLPIEQIPRSNIS